MVKRESSTNEINKNSIHSSMTGVRRSGRLKCQGPVIEENTIDDPIDVDEFLGEDDYVSEDEGDEDIICTQVDKTDVGPSSAGVKKIKSVKTVKKISNKRKMDEKIGNEVAKKRKRIPKSPVKKNKGTGSDKYIFQIRTSPRAFFNAISQLSPIQKSCLEKLGFGKLLNFKVNGIPSKMGFYVVDNFNASTMEIILEKASIEITMDKIADMIGIKNEGVDILDVDLVKDEDIFKNWVDQFGTDKVTPNDVKYMIRNSRVADMNFKLNFVVLFTSIMGGVKTKGFCDLSVLDHINMNTDISKINWCSYIWRCLQRCKTDWVRTNTNSFFLGPITLLTMLYVDGTVCNGFSSRRKRPPTTMWTSELLKERETAEIKSGGLGKGELSGLFVEEEDDPMPENLEGFIWKLTNYVESIKIERAGFNKTLKGAKSLYPGNSQVAFLEDQYIEALRFEREDNERRTCEHTNDQTRTSQRQEPILEADDIFESPMYKMGEQTQQLVCDSSDKVCDEFRRNKVFLEIKAPSFSLGFTQPESDTGTGLNAPEYHMGPETQDEVVKTAEKVVEESSLGQGVGTSSVITGGVSGTNKNLVTPVATTQNTTPVRAVPLRSCPPVTAVGRLRRDNDKRPVPISEVRKSPFIGRVEDVDGSLTAIEKRITKYLFEVIEDHTITLFEAISGHQSTFQQMQSLAPGEYVDNNVVNTWGVVLNQMEVYRSKESPFRMFLPTFVVNNTEYHKLRRSEHRFKSFMEYVVNAIDNDNKSELLKNIDVVFIPVDNGGNKFLFIVDLKSSRTLLIDHESNEKVDGKRLMKKIGSSDSFTVATMLKEDLGQYLMVKNHIKAGNIIGSEIEVVHFICKAKSMEKEAGIFVMRHMETYMGLEPDELSGHLSRAPRKLKTQLMFLRKKYAAKILLSEFNMLKEKVSQIGKGGGKHATKVPLMGL